MSRQDRVRIELVVDEVAEGDYEGIIVRVERGPAPWGLRKLARWEEELGRERRVDWHAYYFVELYRGNTPHVHTKLEEWVRSNRRRPLVLYPCRYSCRRGSAIPLPIKSSASNLLRLLLLTRPGARMIGADVPFEQPVGWGVRVRIGIKTHDWQGDPLPLDPRLRRPMVRKVLEAFPADSLKLEVSSAQRQADSNQQPSTLVSTIFRELNRMPEASQSTSSRFGMDECAVGQATAVVEGQSGMGSSTTADDGIVVGAFVPPKAPSPQQLATRIRRLGPEAAPRGPCRSCGEMTYGRPGESGRCPRCDIRD